MKKILTLLLLFTSTISNAQIASSCNVPPELAVAYHKDIVQLATNYLYQWQSPDTALVHPPQSVLDDISGGLAAILNANTPESDSVFNLYCVHNLNGWPSDYAGFLVQVDTSVAWTQAWQSLITLTGNSYVDSLTSMYGLHVDNFYNWSWGSYAELGVDSAWNIMALMDSLRYATPGVLTVEKNGMIGQAGKIEYEKAGNDRYYSFYFEFIDCTDGCDNYRRWGFRVDSVCNVYYLGFSDWGAFGIQPLPAPINCNLYDKVEELSSGQLNIYPNPATSEIKLALDENDINNICVYDLMGKLVMEADMASVSNEIVLDVSGLNSGLYFVTLTSNEKILRTSFVKSHR